MGVDEGFVVAVSFRGAATSLHDGLVSFLSGIWALLIGRISPAGFSVVSAVFASVGATSFFDIAVAHNVSFGCADDDILGKVHEAEVRFRVGAHDSFLDVGLGISVTDEISHTLGGVAIKLGVEVEEEISSAKHLECHLLLFFLKINNIKSRLKISI